MSRDARTYGWAGQSLPLPTDYAVPVGDVGTGTAVVGMRPFQLHPAMKGALGSDLVRCTWADDGYMYGTWGDGNGFSGGTYVSYGIYRIAGGPEGYTPTDLLYGPAGSGHGKLYGITSIGGVLYMWKSADDWSSYSLYKSTDHGGTLEAAGAVTLANATTGLSALFPIQMGQNQGSAIDTYTYFVATAPDATGPVYLARVPTASLETQAAYEVFSGTPASPTWTTTWASKAAILDSTTVSDVQVLYLSTPDCFLMMTGGPFGTSQDGTLTFEPVRLYWAPVPWGPWTLAATCAMPHHALYGGSPLVSCDFAPKWCSADGSTLWLTFSGLGGWDSFNACEFGVTLGPVSATWADQDGGTTGLYRAVGKGEATDDSKYLLSPAGPTGETVTLQLGPITGTPSAVSTVLRMKRQA